VRQRWGEVEPGWGERQQDCGGGQASGRGSSCGCLFGGGQLGEGKDTEAVGSTEGSGWTTLTLCQTQSLTADRHGHLPS